MKNTLGTRIRYIRESQGLNQNDFAERVGIVRGSVSAYENDTSVPKADTLTGICSMFGVSPQWLLMGVGDPFDQAEDRTGKDQQPSQKIEMLKRRITDQEGILMIPMVEAKLAAGSGSFETSDYSERKYAFREDFLRRKGNASQMVLMRVTGDSMCPSVEDGDVVLIDQSQKSPLPGRIYAIGVEDMVYLKRVNSRPGTIILSSDNPDYAPMEIDINGDLQDQVRIIGKMIWSCREW